MTKALKKKLPFLALSLVLAGAYVLFSSLVNGEPILDTFLDPGTWIFMALMVVLDFFCLRKDFT